MTDFYKTFIEMMAMRSSTKMSYQLTLKMLVKATIYKNLYLGYYAVDVNQTFAEIMLLGLKTRASHQPTLKV